jgi:hypothetical protein
MLSSVEAAIALPELRCKVRNNLRHRFFGWKVSFEEEPKPNGSDAAD